MKRNNRATMINRGAQLTALWLAAGTLATPTIGAELQGRVSDTEGQPLAKAPICLMAEDASDQCTKLRISDRQGHFQFKGLKADTTYRVAVFQDDSANGRKYERFRTYVWKPIVQTVTPSSKQAAIQLEDFIGTFNFSNYQRIVRLGAIDFPELSTIELSADYVVLKVFIPTTDPEKTPETIYLGRITTTDTLSIAASVPLSVRQLAYQIYSESQSLQGVIALTDG